MRFVMIIYVAWRGVWINYFLLFPLHRIFLPFVWELKLLDSDVLFYVMQMQIGIKMFDIDV